MFQTAVRIVRWPDLVLPAEVRRAWQSLIDAVRGRPFFSLPESAGFAVAGGAALVAQGLIHRPTRDLDLFLLDTATSEVAAAATSFEAALGSQGRQHHRVIDQQDFIRLEPVNIYPFIEAEKACRLIDLQAWPTRAGARRAVVEYIGWYNGTRLHSSLGGNLRGPSGWWGR